MLATAFVVLVRLTAGAAPPQEALEALVRDGPPLELPFTMHLPGPAMESTCASAPLEVLLRLLAQARPPLTLPAEFTRCAAGRVRADEQCEWLTCGTAPFGERVVVVVGLRWRDNLEDQEHFNRREYLFALVASKAGRLVEAARLEDEYYSAGTLELDGTVSAQKGGTREVLGKLLPSGRFCPAPVKAEPSTTYRDAKSGELLLLSKECGQWAVAYRAKEGKPLQWMVPVSAEAGGNELMMRFEPSPKQYGLKVDAEKKTVTCTNPDKTVQTFVAVEGK